jgi:hypothetical protein
MPASSAVMSTRPPPYPSYYVITCNYDSSVLRIHVSRLAPLTLSCPLHFPIALSLPRGQQDGGLTPSQHSAHITWTCSRSHHLKVLRPIPSCVLQPLRMQSLRDICPMPSWYYPVFLNLLQDARVTNAFCQLMPPKKMQLISVTILQLTEVRTDTEPCQAAEAGPTVHGLIEFLKKDCCVLLLKLFVSHGFIAPISNT